MPSNSRKMSIQEDVIMIKDGDTLFTEQDVKEHVGFIV